MVINDKDLLDALSSSRILTSMITPAVLISACGTLIFSTSARLGRIFDRVNVMKSELEDILAGKLDYPEQRMASISAQIACAKKRATLIQKSMAALYTSTAFFIAASLAIAINTAYGSPQNAWIPTLIALCGGLFLFAASAILLYESRFNLTFVNRHIDFIEFLQERAASRSRGDT
ncbi:DUF2721 domain-containing protein [Pelotalea chapellei]|uniref:DUF2721 domain-containing protein n=1 Tax=Pelotalea chapellei TaxID=44671 RepID=A0ABS5UCA7_9BACT|nr:DUF2721 domain-containing protein [Pelotalea chapellei]MBT1073322.1 DUF2721 domain-containing protein [Pelotalea chapellei]